MEDYYADVLSKRDREVKLLQAEIQLLKNDARDIRPSGLRTEKSSLLED